SGDDARRREGGRCGASARARALQVVPEGAARSLPRCGGALLRGARLRARGAGELVKVRVGDVKVSFDVEGAWLVPMAAWMVERPTLIVIGDAHASRMLGSSLAELAQVIYLDDGEGDLAGFCEALEIERPILIRIGAEDESADSLPAGFPSLLIHPADPEALDVARRFVHSFQASE